VTVYRERCDLGDHLESEETSYDVTDLSAGEASPEELAHHIRGHWRIESVPRGHARSDRKEIVR